MVTRTNAEYPTPVLDVAGEASASGSNFEVRSPFDDALLAELPMSSVGDADVAFSTARAAQRRWAATPTRERTSILRRFRDLVEANQDRLLDIIQLENGKSRASAAEEVADIVLWSSYIARHGPSALRDRRRRGAFSILTRTTERPVPKGVVGLITPWNFPFMLPVADALPALLAGNAVVVKPDLQTPLSTLYAAQLLRDAGLPRDLFQVVLGTGGTIGSAIIERADFVMFTGSTRTGKLVAAQCADRLITCSAELGGKNPMLVLEDADLDRAATGAVHGCFGNSGQVCVGIERIYVHESLFEAFTTAFVERVKRMRVGAGLDWTIDMGSLISQDQLDTVTRHVEDAKTKGARVLAGGRARPDLGPYMFEPTVLTRVVPDMEVYAAETFGPVVSIYPVRSEDEAVHAANDSPFGLSASVWSRHNGQRVARRIEAGSVNINEGFAAAWASHDAPMGGMKASGIGRRHGREGILKFTEPQTIAQQRLIPVGGPADMPHEQWSKLLMGAIKIYKRVN